MRYPLSEALSDQRFFAIVKYLRSQTREDLPATYNPLELYIEVENEVPPGLVQEAINASTDPRLGWTEEQKRLAELMEQPTRDEEEEAELNTLTQQFVYNQLLEKEVT